MSVMAKRSGRGATGVWHDRKSKKPRAANHDGGKYLEPKGSSCFVIQLPLYFPNGAFMRKNMKRLKELPFVTAASIRTIPSGCSTAGPTSKDEQPKSAG